jgi:hypothetical protein
MGLARIDAQWSRPLSRRVLTRGKRSTGEGLVYRGREIQSGSRERLGADAMTFEQNSVKRSGGIVVAQNGGWRNSKP